MRKRGIPIRPAVAELREWLRNDIPGFGADLINALQKVLDHFDETAALLREISDLTEKWRNQNRSGILCADDLDLALGQLEETTEMRQLREAKEWLHDVGTATLHGPLPAKTFSKGLGFLAVMIERVEKLER